MAEYNQRFDSFDEWVNKGRSWLTRRGPNEKVICYDAKGRLVTNGGGFMLARDEGAFPIRWLWPDQVAILATLHQYSTEAVVAPYYTSATPSPADPSGSERGER